MFASKDQFFTRASAAGYLLTRSLRFRASATAYLNRTFGTPTSTTIWTWSAWVKRGGLGGTYRLFGASTSTYLTFNSSDQLNLTLNGVSAATSTAVFRDPSSWYHIVYQQNGSAQTIYVNNSSVATGSTAASIFNTAIAHQIAAANTTNYFDGYLTEINFIDGQALTPSSFGQTDSTTGVWVPKRYTGTYGNNGFYLPLTDTSSTTNLVKDSSGNANNWTPNNISLTAGTTYDSMIDVPYCTGQTGGTQPSGNYCVWNTLNKSGTITVGNANMYASGSTGTNRITTTLSFPASGKFYMETTVDTASSGSVGVAFGFMTSSASLTAAIGQVNEWVIYASGGGAILSNGTNLGSGSGAFAANDVLQLAVDITNSKAWVGKNNVWYDSTTGTTGNPSAGTNNTFSVNASGMFALFYANTSAATIGSNINTGQRPFSYTPPTGYSALCAPNLAAPTIANGAGYMAATTYTGTGATLSITNTVNSTSFKPDLVWTKSRSAIAVNKLTDSVRGVTNAFISNSTAAQTTDVNGVTAFNSNGFTVGTDTNYNTNAATYIGWQWLCNAGTTSSNTNGSITSTVQVNTTAGFSILTYTGTGANATVGHGLGIAPSAILIKRYSAATGPFNFWHTSLPTPTTQLLTINTSSSIFTNAAYWNSTLPSSTVFSVGTTTNNNASAGIYLAYCFAAITGYSAFGSYVGNASTDGPFVYCGFRPRYVLVTLADVTNADNTYVIDTSRNPYNVAQNLLVTDSSAAESTVVCIDILSNGFKCKSATVVNTTGFRYLYMAFAENPFNYSLAR